MEPKLARPEPAIPASWPVGRPVSGAGGSGLPAVTYKEIFTDPRLQTLIAQALVNNRDLMIAASNIAAAREQYRIQRAQQLPTVNANARQLRRAATRSNRRLGRHEYNLRAAGAELRDRPVRPPALADARQLEQYLATEAGARATRLTLVADIANAWLDYAADSSLLTDRGANRRKRANERQAHPHPARRRSRAAHRPQPGRANPRSGAGRPGATANRGRAGRQRAAAARRSADRTEAVAGVDRRGVRHDCRAPGGRQLLRAAPPARRAPGRISAASRQREHRRGPRRAVPADHTDRPARLCEQRAHQPVHRRRVRLAGRRRMPPTPSSRAAPATPNVRLTRSAAQRGARDVPATRPDRVPRGRRCARPPRRRWTISLPRRSAAGGRPPTIHAHGSAIPCRHRPVPHRARRAADLIMRPRRRWCRHEAYRGAKPGRAVSVARRRFAAADARRCCDVTYVSNASNAKLASQCSPM